jgi:hypothetical protein
MFLPTGIRLTPRMLDELMPEYERIDIDLPNA